MKYLLVFAVLAAVTVSMCYGACFMQKPAFCVYTMKNTYRRRPVRRLIAVGKSRRFGRDCVKCSCSGDGSIGCCDMYARHTSIPPYCKIIKRGCKERVVMKNNPRKQCTGPIAAVGK